MSPRYSIIPGEAVYNRVLTDFSIRVLAVIGAHTNNNGWCVIRRETLAKRLGAAPRSIARSLRQLEAEGYVSVRPRFSERGTQMANHYRVHIPDRSPQDDNANAIDDEDGFEGAGEGDQPAPHRVTSPTPLLPSEDNDLFLERPLSYDSSAPCTSATALADRKGPSKQKGICAVRTPFDELASVLDAERARAVIDHRQRIRAPLTPHAARLLAGKLAEAPDPNAAADLMLLRGWRGFDVKWPAASPQQGQSRPVSLGEHALRRLADLRNGDADE